MLLEKKNGFPNININIYRKNFHSCYRSIKLRILSTITVVSIDKRFLSRMAPLISFITKGKNIQTKLVSRAYVHRVEHHSAAEKIFQLFLIRSQINTKDKSIDVTHFVFASRLSLAHVSRYPLFLAFHEYSSISTRNCFSLESTLRNRPRFKITKIKALLLRCRYLKKYNPFYR